MRHNCHNGRFCSYDVGGEMIREDMKETILDVVDWFWRSILDARYWMRSRFHPKYRYHVVKTGLTPGYYDEDILILHSCMVLLERFITWHGGEQKLEEFTKELLEKPGVWGCDVDSMSPQVVNQTEALAIYHWWKHERSSDEKRMEELWDTVPEGPGIKKYKNINDLEEKMLVDEQEMLHRLIEIRHSLWE